MAHTTDAVVITCIDFRFQEFIDTWLQKTMKKYVFDRVSLAGGVFDFYTILKQVEISNRLHKIKQVVLINHEDCGAYGEAGTKERHTNDLENAEIIIEKLFPHLNVSTYYLRLDGMMENVSRTKRNSLN